MKVIANPASRSGFGKWRWAFWQKYLTRLGIAFTWDETTSAEDCVQKAMQASETVVAVGGDGTINNVLNGVLQAPQPQDMGVLYAGTSPDFCRFHQIPVEKNAAMQVLLAQQARRVDVGVAAYAGSASKLGQPMQRYFSCSCNIGLGAAIARFANTWRRLLGDTLGTGVGVALAMLRHRPFTSTMVVDGQEHSFEQTNHIIVVKNPYLASSLKLSLPVEPDDGSMYVIVIHHYSRWGLLGIIGSLYTGNLLRKKNIFVCACTQAEMVAAPIQEVEFDGDPQGFTPLQASLVPKALSLICGRKI